MSGTAAAALAAALLGWAVMIAVQNWHTMVFVSRLIRAGPDPAAIVDDLAALVRVLPRDPKPVILTVPAKMGTTLLGHITHQLLIRGDDVATDRNLMLDSPYPEMAQVLLSAKLHELEPPYWQRPPFADSIVTVRTSAPLSHPANARCTRGDQALEMRRASPIFCFAVEIPRRRTRTD